MLQSIRISQNSWTNVIFLALAFSMAGCQNRAPSLRMLDSRAAYSADAEDEEVALYQRARHNPDSLVRRSSPRIAKVYLYPHELPTRDYFWGGYVSLVVAADEWTFEKPDDDSDTPAAVRAIHPSKRRAKGKPRNVQ
ncbi:hypothetical protein WDW37_10495 [Bdellovibrionota bacterium FG-1]